MLLWGLWRGEDAPKNTAKLRRAASETKRNDINEQLAPLCTTTITKAVTCGGMETEDDVLVHFLFVLWLFFFSFFLFSFALCVLCVIFSLLLIKCTTSVINFASSGNCSVLRLCLCVLRDDSTSNNNNNNNDDAARRWARCVTKSQLQRVRGEEGEESKRNESKSKSKSNTINTKIALHNGG